MYPWISAEMMVTHGHTRLLHVLVLICFVNASVSVLRSSFPNANRAHLATQGLGHSTLNLARNESVLVVILSLYYICPFSPSTSISDHEVEAQVMYDLNDNSEIRCG